MPFDTWLLYLVTCFGIAVVPGPNALLALTHGALHGSRKTLFTISGGVLGFAIVLALCALGLGALIQASASLFTALKVAGGLYLIWLGFGLWRAAPVSLEATGTTSSRSWPLFRQGLVSAISNPKALLLFTAFIPPFLDPHLNIRNESMNVWLDQLSGNAQLLGQNSLDSSQFALSQLWALTWREAQTLTYADAFLMIMVCFVVAVLLVPLMRKVQPPKQPTADAH